MPRQLAYFRGEIVPIEDANINIMCHGFNYGTGCFEGIRAYWNPEQEELHALFVEEHYRRMFRSAKILFMELPHSLDELVTITLDLVKRCGYQQDIYIRPTLYKEDTIVGVRLHNLRDAFHIYVAPMGNYVDMDRGLKCGVSSWRRIDDTMIPARAKVIGGYINSALAKTEAFHRGFDEAIFLNADGHVCEGSAENVFIVREGTLVTPGLYDNILEGVTRRAIMELAEKELGLTTECRPIDRTELMVADEMMLCGTGAQIAWVQSVDNRPVGDGTEGPVTRKLRELYFSAVRGNLARYSHWVKPVYGKQLTGTVAAEPSIQIG
ncbi:MAG: branched-chain amino acid transaminase [bacterium]|nr:branched-chain amino acid transaminase [bacterium]